MTHPNKAKGNTYEREVVQEANKAGLDAQRAYGSDGRALGEQENVDVVIKSGGVKIRVQCKRKKTIPKIFQLDSGQDAVFFREDRGETYCLVRMNHYLDLLGDKQTIDKYEHR